MKNLLHLVVAALLSTLISGCVLKDYGYRRPFKFNDPKMAQHDFLAPKIIGTGTNAVPNTNYYSFVYYDDMRNNKTNEARLERNSILSELLFLIDGSHGEFVRNTSVLKNGADFVADLAVLGVNGAGTVVGGATTKAIMNAISGGITGSKLAVSKDILQTQAMEAIQAEMDAAMLKRKAQIITSMTNSVDKYPLELGLSDVVNYYYDGTFAVALENLAQDAKTKADTANTSVQAAINSTNSAPSNSSPPANK